MEKVLTVVGLHAHEQSPQVPLAAWVSSTCLPSLLCVTNGLDFQRGAISEEELRERKSENDHQPNTIQYIQ